MEYDLDTLFPLTPPVEDRLRVLMVEYTETSGASIYARLGALGCVNAVESHGLKPLAALASTGITDFYVPLSVPGDWLEREPIQPEPPSRASKHQGCRVDRAMARRRKRKR